MITDADIAKLIKASETKGVLNRTLKESRPESGAVYDELIKKLDLILSELRAARMDLVSTNRKKSTPRRWGK